MSDFKSKLPDFNELGSMAGKIFKGLKSSVDEIVSDYKKKRTEPAPKKDAKPAAKEKKSAKKED